MSEWFGSVAKQNKIRRAKGLPLIPPPEDPIVEVRREPGEPRPVRQLMSSHERGLRISRGHLKKSKQKREAREVQESLIAGADTYHPARDDATMAAWKLLFAQNGDDLLVK